MTHGVHVVADENYGPTFLGGHVFHFRETLFLKLGVPDGQDFVDEQNFRIQMCGDGESETHIHSARITLHRSIKESFYFSEGDDFIELSFYFGAGHSENSAVQENIFASGELRMKTGSDFEQSSDPAVNIDTSKGRLGNAIENF